MDNSPSLIDDYMEITRENQAKYGQRTVLLMQVGAFFEVYGLKNQINGDISGSMILEFCQICQLNGSEKKICIGGNQVIMAGFRDYTLDKYLQKLTDGGFTVVVYVQEKNGKNVKRILHSIHSAGTYISYDNDTSTKATNNVMCIWFDTFRPMSKISTSMADPSTITRDNIIYGVSVIDMYTGKSSIFEFQTPYFMNPTTFDELEKYVSIYCPCEVIVISGFDPEVNKKILQYSGIQCKTIHYHDIRDKENEKIQNCMKQTYIQHILSSFYGEEALATCQEFQFYEKAVQSFCYLVDFIQQHNPDLIRKISIPKFNNVSGKVILANHTLKQLNITNDVSEGSIENQYSSVISLINKCSTSMGKRRFYDQITHPTYDVQWLNREYEIMTMLLSHNYELVETIRSQLTRVHDIEKICRQLVVKKLYPSSMYHLYSSLQLILNIHKGLSNLPDLIRYLCSDLSVSISLPISDEIVRVLSVINSNLDIDACKMISSMSNFDQNIIRTGVCQELDEIIEKQTISIKTFDQIRYQLNQMMKTNDADQDVDFVKVHETEKSGASLQITKKRATNLKTIIKEKLRQDPESQIQLYGDFVLRLDEIKTISASASNDEMDIPILHKISKDLLLLQEKRNTIMAKIYSEFLSKLERDTYDILEVAAEYASRLDVLQNKVFIAKKYNYCCPIINDAAEKSYVEANELRHCLIEHLQKNEIYVTNDICLGHNDGANGMLLYGTNAVGKTSLIRALGIATVLAQSGMFVPCSKFVYKPYKAIYSRILGNDNLFKGLSTFAVEMSELRLILKMADENSLILGDELCSGTETESALSIFMAGLLDLHEKRSSFIFATHFHEIVHYDEMKEMPKLVMKHLSIFFDREHDCLVYDRKLKDGPGNRMYGLEVCKSLYLPEEFLKRAHQLRNKYYQEGRGNLSDRTSNYTVAKIRGACEKCKEQMGQEIHHVQEQHRADENGFIGTFHKNHPANLMSVCKKCHDDFHTNSVVGKTSPTIMIKKKTTAGYRFLDNNTSSGGID